MGIQYHKETEDVAVLIQGKMKDLRTYTNENFYDTILILMTSTGELSRSISVSQGDTGYDMFHQPYSLIGVPTNSESSIDYYFAGHSLGYKTQYHHHSSDSYDTFIYKYNFFEDLKENTVNFFDCLTVKAVSTSTVSKRIQRVDDVSDEYFKFDLGKGDIDWTVRASNFYKLYEGKHFKVQPLIGSLVIPRPCAYKSASLPDVSYLRGQGRNDQVIGGIDDVSDVIARMDTDSELRLINGEPAE